jgi:hypothetical protein
MKTLPEELVELPSINLADLIGAPDTIQLERAIAHGTRAMLRKVDAQTCAKVLDQVSRFRGEASTPIETIQRALELAHAVRSVLRLQNAAQRLAEMDPDALLARS